MLNFCTLFDSFYLDKAMALYDSLENVSNNFNLYIFCFDKKAFDIITALKWEHSIVIPVEVIENAEMLKIKGERSKAEYCWTCTPIIIEYVLENYMVEDCTYIDADLFFFDNPQILIDEIKKSGADVSIVEHRFKKDRNYKKKLYKAGKYCVQFNYFSQSDNSKKILRWWKDRCLEWCYYKLEPERMGDQKYLEKFSVLFSGVHELQHLGGGVAPWNLGQYRLASQRGEHIILSNKDTNETFPLIFYHFQNLRYLNDTILNLKSQTKNEELKKAIYFPYLKSIVKNEKSLKEEFGFVLKRRKKYSKNWFNTFLQKYIVALKITSFSDLVNLKQFKQG